MSRIGHGEADELGDALTGLLTPGAAQLYASLLADPDRPVDEHEPAAAELITAGLAAAKYGGGGIFLHAPRVALARALDNATRSWLESAPDFGALASAMMSIETRSPVEPAPDGHVPDPEERQQVAESLVVGATREVCVLQPYYEGDEYEGQDPDELGVDDSWTTAPDGNSPPGVTFRFVYDDRLLRMAGFEGVIRHELELGAQVRITNDRIPSFLMIIDDATAAFTPDPNGPGEVSTAPGLVALLGWSFEAFWARAVPLDRGDELSPTLRTVLAMIGLGRTNRQISHTLGVHERTVRRRVDDLLDHFGEPDRNALIRRAAALGDRTVDD